MKIAQLDNCEYVAVLQRKNYIVDANGNRRCQMLRAIGGRVGPSGPGFYVNAAGSFCLLTEDNKCSPGKCAVIVEEQLSQYSDSEIDQIIDQISQQSIPWKNDTFKFQITIEHRDCQIHHRSIATRTWGLTATICTADAKYASVYTGGYSLIDLNITTIQILLEKLHERFIILQRAGSIKHLVTSVILDEELAGIFAHECVGHLREADIAVRYPFTSGHTAGNCSTAIVVYDEPIWEYDDEGIETRPVTLYAAGQWQGLLHSSRTALREGTISNGCGRCFWPWNLPIPRQRRTVIGVREATAISETLPGDRIEVAGSLGGRSGPTFLLRCQIGYVYNLGKLVGVVGPLAIYADTSTTLATAQALDAKPRIFRGGDGGCFKYGDGPLWVESGGVPLLLSQVHVTMTHVRE